MKMNNLMELRFEALPENESFARMVISAFLIQKNPPLNSVSEVRTAVSEAVTNSIVHAYREKQGGLVILRAEIREEQLLLEIEDYGCGIADIERAMQPFYTSQPEEERTGIGFALMQSFMDSVSVSSVVNGGTCVKMAKRLCL